VESAIFDTEAYRRARIAAVQPKYAWANADAAQKSEAERTKWQQAFRDRFAFLLGNLNAWERPPLAAVVSDVVVCDGYRRESVIFTTRPGLTAFGYFLIPDSAASESPAVLCIPGHGVGVDGMCGLAEEAYAEDFALQCVRQGYPTFALEIAGFGRRRDAAAKRSGPGTSSCGRDSTTALMLGETMSGWRVWDAMRALDYLQTRTDCVDPTQLAIMGISGEMPDLAALVAPRALFAVTGDTDPIFPLGAFWEAARQAEEIYRVFGQSSRFDSEIFAGGHRFYGVGAFDFLRKHIG